MTCSPDQSTFTNAKTTLPVPNNKRGKEYVMELDYAVDMEYAQVRFFIVTTHPFMNRLPKKKILNTVSIWYKTQKDPL